MPPPKAAAPSFDLLITNAQIVDGTGGSARTGAIAIRAGKVAAVGEVTGTAARTIDAHGRTVAPGFIDMHSHSDLLLLEDGSAPSKIRQGVTTEVLGDGEKVNGLIYKDRNSDAVHEVQLEGVFVQIGLVPNTEWLHGAVALTPRGEIEVDHRGETSQAGIFAAGDATTTPYKQIVIAMGEGSKAGLSAFDYLIRTVPAEEAAEAA